MRQFHPDSLLLALAFLAACSAGSIEAHPPTPEEAGSPFHSTSKGGGGSATNEPKPQPEASIPVDSGSKVSCADPPPGGELGDVPPGADAPATPITEGDILDPQSGAMLARYALSAPKTFAPPGTTDPTKQLGLFIAFHEHGGAARDEVPTVIESLARLKLSGDYVVIGMGQGDESTHGYTKVVDHQIALKLIDWAKKTYPINPRRVYYWGRGEGATMAQELGTEHPELVTALITYSWGSKSLPKVMNPTVNVPDFYVSIGLNDYVTHPPWVRDVYAEIKMLGYNIIYREIPGLGGDTHHPPSNDDAILWATRSRHKTLPLSPEEQALINPYADASAAAELCPNTDVFRSLIRVGGTQTGSVMPPIMGAQDDVTRALAAKSSGLAMFGNEADTALAGRLKDSSKDVRAAALQALAIQANWRYMPAQQALIATATDTTWDLAERGLAVDGIGAAVKLQMGGAFQDPPLFKALVTLLDDPDLTLRTKAFAILSPIMMSGYKPDASEAARQPEVAKWQQWLLGITAKN
jgi:hypothetical protein